MPNEGGHTLDFEFRAQSRARRLSNSGSSENSPSETVRRGVLRQRLGKVPSVRRASQTDLSDAEWSYIEPHMPTPKGTGHPKIPLSARARLRGGGTLQAEDEEVAAKGDLTSGHYPEFIPPTVAEVRLLIRAMTAPKRVEEFRLGWSLFRRAHQARWQGALTRQLTEQKTPPTMMLLVGVSPSWLSPAKLAHRQYPFRPITRPGFSPTPNGSAL